MAANKLKLNAENTEFRCMVPGSQAGKINTKLVLNIEGEQSLTTVSDKVRNLGTIRDKHL